MSAVFTFLIVANLPSFADGCEPVDECEEGILRSLGEGGYASAFAVRSRLRADGGRRVSLDEARKEVPWA